MRPRGLIASWQFHRRCHNYAFDKAQPTRAAELEFALAEYADESLQMAREFRAATSEHLPPY